jgi:hypothetical protein
MVQEYLDRIGQAEKQLAKFCIDGLNELKEGAIKVELI